MKIILFVTILLFNTLPLFSQSEFKIALDRIEWKNPVGNSVTLEINLKITNIGSISGPCENLKGIWLYSDDSFYNFDINIGDYSKKIFQIIKPGDFIYTYISFEVPKAAGGLYLKFNEENGGAEKFITDSYNNYLQSDAENSFEEKKYSNAIDKYILCSKNDLSQKNMFDLRIADCYEKIADGFIGDFNIYRVSDNLEKAIKNYKLCLGYDFKRSSVKEKISRAYEELGDFQRNASNLVNAKYSYLSSLEYGKSTAVNNKITGIDNIAIKKEEQIKKQKEIKAKKEAYKNLIEPQTGFTLRPGIGYHSNKSSSVNAPFWNLEMDIPVKLYTQKKYESPLNVFLNFEAGYSGFIGTESELYKYLNVNNPVLTLKRSNSGPIIGETYLNCGVGVSLLSESLKPMLAFYYGIYGQNTSFSLVSVNNPNSFSFEKYLSEFHIGQGFKIELSLKIGSAFIIGYAYKNYKIESNLYFLDNKYGAHYFNIGLSSF